MPRVMVTTDQAEPGDAAVLLDGDATVLLDEQVRSIHLSTDHSAMQFIERLGWAISDAEDAERVQVHRQARGGTRSPRARARPRPRARHPLHA